VFQPLLAFILRIVALLTTFWFLRRLFYPRARNRQAGGGPPNEATAPASRMVRDPVCGMYMDARLAVRLEHRGESLFFCSEECKAKFLGGTG
jgi:uncharacterized protein